MRFAPFMHSVLFCNLSRQYIPAPKANLVKVVINGESWRIFANQQQFNKDFLKENYEDVGALGPDLTRPFRLLRLKAAAALPPSASQ